MRLISILMLLSLSDGGGSLLPHAFAETETKKSQYTCPMHPSVRSDHPGECPICHMKLVPLRPSGTIAPVAQEPERTAGERKVKFYRNPMDPTIRSKTPAKDSMGMDYIPVYEAESQRPPQPQVEGRAAFHLSPEQFKLSGTRLVRAERRDLEQELHVPGRALGGGLVSFQAFEQDLAAVRPGLPFRASAPSLVGERLAGTVTSIESILDPMTRTARVNGTLTPAPSSPLRAESSLSATLLIRHPKVLVVPEGAVLHTGTRDLVFVVQDDGTFVPRAVTLGVRSRGFFEIKSGLSEGESVSAGSNFLLDSESKIQANYE